MPMFDSCPVDSSAWESFVDTQPQALFTHRHGYVQVLATTYRLPAVFLESKTASGQLVGVLPLMLFAAPDRARRLISLPYSDGAGPLAEDEDVAGDLLRQALLVAERVDCLHLEVRQAGDAPHISREHLPGWKHVGHTFKTGLARDLPSSSCTLWAELPDKVRNQVRKARKNGATVRTGGSELLDDFYAVFSENMRDLGSPVHDSRLFAALLGDPAMHAEVVVVSMAGEPVAAALVFTHRHTMFNPWASSLRRLRPLCPNMLLYWAMLDLAITRGCRVFDFGRSTPGSPAHLFKQQWGAERRPLVWHVFSKRGAEWQPQLENLADPAWKTLSLTQSRLQGPAVRRWISL